MRTRPRLVGPTLTSTQRALQAHNSTCRATQPGDPFGPTQPDRWQRYATPLGHTETRPKPSPQGTSTTRTRQPHTGGDHALRPTGAENAARARPVRPAS